MLKSCRTKFKFLSDCVEAFLPHKFFAGAPQSTDFCFVINVISSSFSSASRNELFRRLSKYYSTSSDSEMSFDSEDSEIYYIAEENDDSHLSTTQSE